MDGAPRSEEYHASLENRDETDASAEDAASDADADAEEAAEPPTASR